MRVITGNKNSVIDHTSESIFLPGDRLGIEDPTGYKIKGHLWGSNVRLVLHLGSTIEERPIPYELIISSLERVPAGSYVYQIDFKKLHEKEVIGLHHIDNIELNPKGMAIGYRMNKGVLHYAYPMTSSLQYLKLMFLVP